MPFLRAVDELEFAVPDEGRITLGVFDGSGKLVRLLHKLAKEGDFQVGLNGLITSWDGKNGTGERVPSGHYHVRGYLVGEDVRVSGEDFLFNDWAADSGFPGFNKIHDFSLLENGDVVLLAGSNSPDYVLTRFSLEKGFLWSAHLKWNVKFFGGKGFTSFRKTDSAGHPLGGSVILISSPAPPPGISPLLTSNSANTFVITAAGSGIYALGDGKETFSTGSGGGVAPLSLAADESEVFVSSPGGLTTICLPAQKPGGMGVPPVGEPLNGQDADSGLLKERVTHPPAAFTSMDADASTLIGASQDGVWIRRESFQPITLPTAAKSVTLGMPGTFWFVGEENGAPFVGQASFAGEILRALRLAADDPKPDKIRASRTAEKFALIESLPALQRLRVMARAESGEWTIEWERTIRDCSNFGFVNGKSAADAGSAEQEKNLRFRLKENPLTGKRDFLTVHAESDASGSRLVSPDGLPLVDISSRNDIRRTAIRRGDKPDSLRLLQGNGSFVEEFSITGLDDILPLDAGGIDIP